jgi:hypothetical protein
MPHHAKEQAISDLINDAERVTLTRLFPGLEADEAVAGLERYIAGAAMRFRSEEMRESVHYVVRNYYAEQGSSDHDRQAYWSCFELVIVRAIKTRDRLPKPRPFSFPP